MSFLVQTLGSGAKYVGDSLYSIGKDLVDSCKPDSIPHDARRRCIWLGLAGVVASFAAKSFGAISYATSLTYGGISASVFAAGATGMPIFFLPPLIFAGYACFLASCAVINSLANANFVYVVNLN